MRVPGRGEQGNAESSPLDLGKVLFALLAVLLLAGCPGDCGSGNNSDLMGPSNKSPTATIASPADGSSYASGDTITFQGSATDPEDGDLSGSSLVWTSDGTQIGTGSSFKNSQLSVGTHTVTLTATDSQGTTGTASVSITVQAASAPQEQRLAFTSNAGGAWDVYSIRPDGTGVMRITDLSLPSAGILSSEIPTQPAWSPDGRLIAFQQRTSVVTTIGNVRSYTISTVAPDGSGVTNVASDPAIHPSWSPSGDSIAFEGAGSIWVTGRDGGDPREVVPTASLPAQPGLSPQAWSPDSTGKLFTGQPKQLLFFWVDNLTFCRSDSHEDILVADLSGMILGGFAAICQLGGDNFDATISPDGSKLAFTNNASGQNLVWVLDLVSGQLEHLSSSATTTGISEAPVWSPDSQQIAFDSGNEVYVMNADLTGVRRITNDPNNPNIMPSWSPQQ